MSQKRLYGRQVARNDREPTRPILKSLGRNVLHKFGERLEGDQTNTTTANPGGDFRIGERATQLDLGRQLPTGNALTESLQPSCASKAKASRTTNIPVRSLIPPTYTRSTGAAGGRTPSGLYNESVGKL